LGEGIALGLKGLMTLDEAAKHGSYRIIEAISWIENRSGPRGFIGRGWFKKTVEEKAEDFIGSVTDKKVVRGDVLVEVLGQSRLEMGTGGFGVFAKAFGQTR
jgi:hypothetical protein